MFPQYYVPNIAPSGVVNAASFQPGVLAPGSLMTIFGADLGGPDTVVGVSLRDASGAERPLHLLYSGPGQLNGVVPDDSVTGSATLIVRREGWRDAEASQRIAEVSPGLFTLNKSGLAAASLVRSKPGQQQSWEPVFLMDGAGNIVAKPIVFGTADEDLFLVLYCTGVRGHHAGQAVTVQLGSLTLAADYAGPQLQYEGLDQINIKLPRTLAGTGNVSISVKVDGSSSNTASVTFR